MSRKKRVQQTDAENDILEDIVKNGPSHIYPFHCVGSRRYISSRATIYRAKDNLLQNNFIRLATTEKVNGRIRKVYTLTAQGLCKFLAYSDWLYEKPELIMEKGGHLLPILKKLPLFDKHGIEWNLRHCLKKVVKYPAFNMFSVKDTQVTNYIEDQVCKMLTEKASADLRVKYDRVLQEDPELREAAKKYLRARRGGLHLMSALQATEQLKLVFPLLESDEPDWNKKLKSI